MGKTNSFVDSNEGDQLEEFHPGCMWGMIHAFQLNHRVKKLLPHSPKKHRRRHVKGKRRSDIDDSNEVESLLDDEEVAGKFLVDGDNKETRSSSKRSILARIKSLVSEEMSKEENLSSLKQQKGQTFSPHKQLTRTYSIHHLETLNHGPTKGKIAGWRQKIIYLHSKPDSIHPAQIKKTDNDIPSQNQSLVNEEDDDPEQNHGNNDILEMFRVNKDLFQKFLYNTDDVGTTIHLRSPQNADKSARLSKSGSFPQAGQSDDRNVRSSKLSHKIDEVWSFKKKREKLLSSKSGPLLVHYDRESNANGEEESKFIEEDKYNGSDYGHGRTHVRTLSVEESLDRYIRLLEQSSGSGKDSSSYRSKSLKLRNHEYEITSELTQPRISFKRGHSVSHVETFFAEMEELEELKEEKEMSSAEEEAENSQTENRTEEISNPNELIITDGSDSNYIKKILELSGFTANDLFGAWNSSESPLDPSLYEDMETYWPSCDVDETTSSFSHHQILFDLTNEAIIQIYDRSYTYYPRALSSICWVRPLPLGNHFLEEVLKRIDRSFNKQVEPDQQPVDCILGQDFAEDYGWMNLQFESECVALEIEELLIDELLEELIYS